MTKKEIIISNKKKLENTLYDFISVAKGLESSLEKLNIDSSKSKIDSNIEHMLSMASELPNLAEFTKNEVNTLVDSIRNK